MTGPALLLAAALLAPAPRAPQAGAPARTCIQVSSGSDTQYHPVDDHTVVIESGGRWWRLTTSPSSRMLEPQSFFVNDIRGTSTLCSPLDFDLSVATLPGGFREPLIVQEFTPLTREEGRTLLRRTRR